MIQTHSKKNGHSQKDHKLVFKTQGEHSAILLTFIKLPFVSKSFELPFYTGFIVHLYFAQD